MRFMGIMDNLVIRGNPDIMRSIAKEAKNLSTRNGLAEGVIIGNNSKGVVVNRVPTRVEGGAYASMMRRNASGATLDEGTTNTNKIEVKREPRVNSVHEGSDFYSKKLDERLLESVETLSLTKEYFNATSSLFTLFSMGKLTEGVLKSLNEEDLQEIKGIIREFKVTLDKF